MNTNTVNQDSNVNISQSIESEKNSQDIQMSQNKIIENQIIKKLALIECFVDESIKKHADKSITINRKSL